MASTGLIDLSENLERAVQGPSQTLPDRIKGALVGWIENYVFEILWTVLIFVVFAFVFYGAFLYFTAYGDENRATMAKKTITYAFIGLAVSAAAMGIAMYINNILVDVNYVPAPVTVPTQHQPPATGGAAPSGGGGSGTNAGGTSGSTTTQNGGAGTTNQGTGILNTSGGQTGTGGTNINNAPGPH